MRPSAILFDLDDTLISPHKHRTAFWKEALIRVWKSHFVTHKDLPGDIDQIVAAIDFSANHFWSDPERHKIGRLDLSAARLEILEKGIGRDSRFSGRMRKEIADCCGQLMTEQTTLYPDAINTLTALKQQGVRLALITNGASEAQRAKIAKFSLDQYFLHIQIEGEVGVGKPEPVSYERALSAIDAQPRQTWIVGDNLEWEVAAPQRLGIFSVWRDPRGKGILPPGSNVRPDKIISHLIEVLD